MLYVFEYIYENYRIITLPNHWRIWFYSLLLMEFMFYCAHRLLHEINFLWASHQYHHSSKHFNIGTAIRLSWFELNIVYVSFTFFKALFNRENNCDLLYS